MVNLPATGLIVTCQKKHANLSTLELLFWKPR